MSRPGPSPNPGALRVPTKRTREACLSACESRHQACRAEIDRQIEADCLRSRAETCEQLYQSCMSDSSKLFMGAGITANRSAPACTPTVSRSAAKGCAAALQRAEERCDDSVRLLHSALRERRMIVCRLRFSSPTIREQHVGRNVLRLLRPTA